MPIRKWEIIRWSEKAKRTLEHPSIDEAGRIKNYVLKPGGEVKTEQTGLGNGFRHLLKPGELEFLTVEYEETAMGAAEDTGDCDIPVFNTSDQVLEEMIAPELGGYIKIKPGLTWWPADIVRTVIQKLFSHKCKLYDEALIEAKKLRPDGSKPEPPLPVDLPSDKPEEPEKHTASSETPAVEHPDASEKDVKPLPGSLSVVEWFDKYRPHGAKDEDIPAFCKFADIEKGTLLTKEEFWPKFKAFKASKAESSGE